MQAHSPRRSNESPALLWALGYTETPEDIWSEARWRMFEFLSRGRAKGDKKEPDVGPSTMPQTMQFSATQRDMARLTLQHLLRHHAIPAQWIRGELVPIHIPGEGDALLLQLEILQWNDALVLNAFALQNELLQGLRRFDPATNGTRYLFSWKFHPDCGCPYTALPDAAYWRTQTESTQAPAAVASPPLPAHVAEPEPADDDHGFAPTQLRGIEP